MTIHGLDITTGKKTTREWTQEELAAHAAGIARDKEIRDKRPYDQKRRDEYPDIGEQLDAIMKWVAGENEITATPELKSIAMSCMAVKSKYPKPAGVA